MNAPVFDRNDPDWLPYCGQGARPAGTGGRKIWIRTVENCVLSGWGHLADWGEVTHWRFRDLER